MELMFVDDMSIIVGTNPQSRRFECFSRCVLSSNKFERWDELQGEVTNSYLFNFVAADNSLHGLYGDGGPTFHCERIADAQDGQARDTQCSTSAQSDSHVITSCSTNRFVILSNSSGNKFQFYRVDLQHFWNLLFS